MKRATAGAAMLALLASHCVDAAQPVPTAADGMSWESIPRLPDFSGWWIWDYMATNDFPAGGALGPLPYRPEILKPAAQASQQFAGLLTRGLAVDATVEEALKLQALLAQGYCHPPGFAGTNASEGSLEFLFTPGRATILDETGLVRRIVLNHTLPPEIVESSAGISVGRWEGRTLVIETGGFDSGARLGRKARSVERIWLKEPDVLQIDLTLTSPDMFTEPYRDTWFFRRDREHQFTEWSNCKSNDRSVDPATKLDRFDLTPPPDLPPPPKD